MLKQIHIKSLRSTFLTLWKELNNKRQVIIPKRYRKILKLPPSANAFNMTEAGEMHLASRTGPLTRNEVSQKSSARKPTITGGHRLTTTSFFFSQQDNKLISTNAIILANLFSSGSNPYINWMPTRTLNYYKENRLLLESTEI